MARLAADLHTTPEPNSERPAGVLDASGALLFHVPNLLPEAFAQALNTCQREIDVLADTAPARRLHGDLTPKNVLRSHDGVHAIDFQDLMWGYVVQDLAHTIYGLRHDDHDGSLTRTFLHTYGEIAPLPDLRPLPHLLMARRAFDR